MFFERCTWIHTSTKREQILLNIQLDGKRFMYNPFNFSHKSAVKLDSIQPHQQGTTELLCVPSSLAHHNQALS